VQPIAAGHWRFRWGNARSRGQTGADLRGASLLLASVGLYGVLSYLMTQRTNGTWRSHGFGRAEDHVLRLICLMIAAGNHWVGARIGIQCRNHAADRSMLYGHQTA